MHAPGHRYVVVWGALVLLWVGGGLQEAEGLLPVQGISARFEGQRGVAEAIAKGSALSEKHREVLLEVNSAITEGKGNLGRPSIRVDRVDPASMVKAGFQEVEIDALKRDSCEFGKFVVVRQVRRPFFLGGCAHLLVVTGGVKPHPLQVEVFDVLSSSFRTMPDVSFAFPGDSLYMLVEPYVTRSGHIRVSNPTHLVRLNDQASYETRALPKPLPVVPLVGCYGIVTEQEWREAANRLLSAREFVRAAAAYTRALEIVIHDEEEHGSSIQGGGLEAARLLSNRAEAMLGLEEDLLAARDAEWAVHLLEALCYEEDDLEVEAQVAYSEMVTTCEGEARLRLARALVRLQAYRKAEEVIVIGWGKQALTDQAHRLLGLIGGVRGRLWEAGGKKYDWEEMIRCSKEEGGELWQPDFVSEAVKPSKIKAKGGIRGLTAVKSIRAGELLVAWKGITAEPKGGPSQMHAECARRVLMSALAGGKGADYIEWFPKDGAEAVLADTEVSPGGRDAPHFVDYNDLRHMVDTCAFAVQPKVGTGKGSQPTRMGFFGFPSLTNHDCAPNCWYAFLGDFMLVGSVVPIQAGQEITISYKWDSSLHYTLDPNGRSDSYLKHFPSIWGFQCACTLCGAHSAAKPAFRTAMNLLNAACESSASDLRAIEALVELAPTLAIPLNQHPHLSLALVLAAERAKSPSDAVKLWREAAECCDPDQVYAFSSQVPPSYIWGRLAEAQLQAGFPHDEVMLSAEKANRHAKVLGFGSLRLAQEIYPMMVPS